MFTGSDSPLSSSLLCTKLETSSSALLVNIRISENRDSREFEKRASLSQQNISSRALKERVTRGVNHSKKSRTFFLKNQKNQKISEKSTRKSKSQENIECLESKNQWKIKKITYKFFWVIYPSGWLVSVKLSSGKKGNVFSIMSLPRKILNTEFLEFFLEKPNP